MRERVTFVKDYLVKSPYFFEAPTMYDPEVVKKRWKRETPEHMKALRDEIAPLEQPHKEDYETALHRVAEKVNVKNSDLIHPLRLAVSGMGTGPGLYDILFILGREETIRRINAAVQRIR
jgi:glutamyl-tRNA synthetase